MCAMEMQKDYFRVYEVHFSHVVYINGASDLDFKYTLEESLLNINTFYNTIPRLSFEIPHILYA